ncbi:threonine ammonia-lyase [Paraclostridium ghonii]|uniref:Threonine dehydratase n=1 Tax=Paraclostridium ghonii TaxID=29358 RepID=A0ABU0MXG2_9FIRM|nr:threonine/serine dehydratase [Paeniclostridium ghonii]MDQ0555444.1 threonine dehydratase [Paeniclostridium ghonii]
MRTKLKISDVLQAKSRINDYVKKTPLIRANNLEKMFKGAQIWLKLENMQHTGAFKIRGVANKMLSLSEEELANGVTAASSGNHAQAVAYMAKSLNTKATIVMPENAPIAKIEGAKGYGASVVLYGFTGQDRDMKCDELIKENKYCLVHSHMDPLVITGHATVAVEAWEQMNGQMDEIIVPCGAGSLASGTAFAMKQIDPTIKVTGVEPASVPLFTESIKENKAITVEMGQTIADGLRISKAEDINFNLIRDNIDKVEIVSESSIAQAVKEIALKEKFTVEPSACVGLAALLENKIDTSKGRNICIVITGGNIDASLYSDILLGNISI